MIFGDPRYFAIIVEPVELWSNTGDINGVLSFIIDGHYISNQVNIADLLADAQALLTDNALVTQPPDKRLFSMKKNEAFNEIMARMKPAILDASHEPSDDFLENYAFQASPPSVEDSGCYLFAISDGDKVRVLGAQCCYLVGDVSPEWVCGPAQEVYEATLPENELRELVLRASKYIFELKQ